MISIGYNPKNINASVVTALQILDFLSEHGHNGLKTIAESCKLNKIVAHRIIKSIELSEFMSIRQSKTDEYSLGLKCASYCAKKIEEYPAFNIIKKHIKTMLYEFDLTITLNFYIGGRILFSFADFFLSAGSFDFSFHRRIHGFMNSAASRVFYAFNPEAFFRIKAYPDELSGNDIKAIKNEIYSICNGTIAFGQSGDSLPEYAAVPIREIRGKVHGLVAVISLQHENIHKYNPEAVNEFLCRTRINIESEISNNKINKNEKHTSSEKNDTHYCNS